jgi:deoxyribodipyrimidine photo-lyase
MQAGETGINMLRIYNPIKNSYEHDSEGEFRKWVPRIKKHPCFIHEPYKMTYLDQKFNDFEVGVNYQNLSLNGRTRKFASDFLWKMKKKTRW